jgi:predicted Fe-Mo cluster-binding NifX family protein
MGTPNVPNKTTALARNKKISEGVNKHFAKVKSLTIAGDEYTPKSLLAVLSAEDDASLAVDSTRKQLEAQVVTHRTAKVTAAALRSALKVYILGNYGKKAVQMLGDFGMSVPKGPGARTVDEKSKAVAKNLATRAARHTMGNKQKLRVTGDVSSPATTAETSSSSAPAATPAQVVSAATPAQVASAATPAQVASVATPAQPTASH